MPNWNNNNILIDGPEEKIVALWTSAQPVEGKSESLLSAMVPIGEWDYNNAIEAWGTKWDISLEGLNLTIDGTGRAQITGWADSAWSPPICAFETYAENNPDVYMSLEYFEPGADFIGMWNTEGADESWEDVGSLLDTTEEDDPVLYELLENFGARSWYESDELDE